MGRDFFEGVGWVGCISLIFVVRVWFIGVFDSLLFIYLICNFLGVIVG